LHWVPNGGRLPLTEYLLAGERRDEERQDFR
jgi:hypothetical protein